MGALIEPLEVILEVAHPMKTSPGNLLVGIAVVLLAKNLKTKGDAERWLL